MCVMDKYMKMSDYFVGDILPEDIVILDGGVATAIYTSEEAAAHAINSHDELVAEVGLLRSVCAEAYQIAGALDAPVEVLDNLSAAANGEDLPHETFLPVASHDLIAEIERLRFMISECYPYIKDKADWGNEYEVDLANRLFDAAK